MQYREITPGPAAARYIHSYWILQDDSPSDGVQRIVPDGKPALILNFANPFEYSVRGAWARQPDCFFVGQITAPLLLRATGPACMLGVNFHAHGASPVFGMPVRELTDAVVSVEDISKRVSCGLLRLRDASMTSLSRGALDAIFGAAPNTSAGDSCLIPNAVSQFERSGGKLSVRTAAQQAGLSVRQFERRFRDAVGIAPKLFSRMQRFQRVFRAIESAGKDWAGAAIQCGYFDQAHLIRDFREFAGTTPAALLTEEIDLVRHFMHSQAVSHFSNTPVAGAL